MLFKNYSYFLNLVFYVFHKKMRTKCLSLFFLFLLFFKIENGFKKQETNMPKSLKQPRAKNQDQVCNGTSSLSFGPVEELNENNKIFACLH